MRAIAVVGANLAGGRAVEALRQAGFEGKVALIGEEPWLPYERPPLSKELLWDRGKLPENFFLQAESWYEENHVELHLGKRATALDSGGGKVLLSDGSSVAADRVLLTTGGAARRLNLAGANASNVHYLRTKDDADRLAADLIDGARVVIIGMGVIGAEVAASAAKLGCKVSAIEPAAAPMERALGQRFGSWLATEHEKRGVKTHLGRSVTGMKVLDDKVTMVELDDETRLDCDLVVVGVGIVPAADLARDAGLEVGNGIVVDRECRTSNPMIFAAGDVAEQESYFGGRIRQETYQNAAEQGQAAALAMLGHEIDFCKPAWFWSDQFDLNIQFCGHIPVTSKVVVRGEIDSNEFSAFFLNDGQVEGILCVNRPRDMGVGKRIVERRLTLAPAPLADAAIPLRELMKKAG